MNKNNCVIIVSSCDAYSDAWNPFFTLFFRYWPDCPFSIYLVSNYKGYKDKRVISIRVGEDKKWATNIRIALDNNISTPYLIYMQEDYFLRSSVDTDYINKIIDYAVQKKAACIRLFPEPGPDLFFQNDLNLGKISPEARDRVSLQAALWEKNVLGNIIKDGESGWDVETRGGERSKDYLFLSVPTPALDYLLEAGIIKGKWTVGAIKLCRREGVKVDLSKRPIAYGIAWRSFLDRLRKKKFIRKLRTLPIIGGLGSRCLKKLMRMMR